MTAPLSVRPDGSDGWAVAHDPSGLFVVRGCGSRQAAEVARQRVAGLPIDWASFDMSAVASPDWRERRWPLDETARRMLIAEGLRALGISERWALEVIAAADREVAALRGEPEQLELVVVEPAPAPNSAPRPVRRRQLVLDGPAL